MLAASYKNHMGSKSYLCTRPDVLQIQQKEFDLHKERLTQIKYKGSFLKRYIDSNPIEIKHNVKTDAIKANENYARFQKNVIIHEHLKSLKKPANKKIENSNQNLVNHSLINRKKEAKRIDEENKKTHKRLQRLFQKGSDFSSDKFMKHSEKYEKALSLRKRNETSPSNLKIIVEKEKKKFSPKYSSQTPQTQKSLKFNHFNIKLKDYSTLLLTAKSLNSTRKIQTIE